MKTKLQCLVICFAIVTTHLLHAQGYIVPNGVVKVGNEIQVWNPDSGGQITSFIFTAIGQQQPTDFANIFNFNEPVTIGVRVFFVSPNDIVSLPTITTQNYTEFAIGNNYVLQEGTPFYVGLYTGYNFAPPYPPSPPYYYIDPVYGWAELENVQGVIQVIDYAVAYKAAGIYAGTQNIIQTPEPSTFALVALGSLLLGCRRWKK